MSDQIPADFVEFFKKPIIANLSTVLPNGQPQVNPVWCDFDGTYVRLNSAKGRAVCLFAKHPRFSPTPYLYLNPRPFFGILTW